MSKTKILFSGLFLAIIFAGNAYSGSVNDVFGLSIAPISNPSSSYQVAASKFLPEFEDSENGWASNKIGSVTSRQDCSSYSLKTCPSNGKCTKCPVGAGYKLDSCNTGYTKTGDTCIKKTEFCVENATTFKNNIPTDYVCSKIAINPLCNSATQANCDKCYSSCYKINCSGYPLDCQTISKTALHIATTEICPNCKNSTTSKCAKAYCKITECESGYKVNAAGTACIEKDDTCPNGYYKSCETGTQGTPQYTEKGTACYQCKPKTVETCESQIKALGSNYYPVSSTADIGSDEDKYKASDVLVLMNNIQVDFAVITSNVESASKYNGTLSACSSQTTMKKLISTGEGIGFKPKSAIQVSVPVETTNSMILGNVTFTESYNAEMATISNLQDFSSNIKVTFKKPVTVTDLNILASDTVTFEDTLTSENIQGGSNYINFNKSVKTKILSNINLDNNTVYQDSKGCKVTAKGEFNLEFNNVAFTALPSACVKNVTTDGAKCTYNSASITYNNSCSVNNAQKCLDEGYRLQEDWPKPTASNDAIIPSTMLADFMKKVFSLKPALAISATTTVSTADTATMANTTNTVSQGCPANMINSCKQNCTSSCQAYYCCGVLATDQPVIGPSNPIIGDTVDVIDDSLQYTFTVTETCPYDSNYVKGEWEKTTPSIALCAANCKTCDSTNTKCVECKIGYTLNNGRCIIISASTCNVGGCKTCVSGDPSTCSVCESGFTLSNGGCLATAVGCTPRVCDGEEYCCQQGGKTPCDDGYNSSTSALCKSPSADKQ